MKKTEKEMRDIFSQDIQISDVVETRIQETYKQLEKRNVRRRKAGSARRIAAAIAVFCMAVPGVVYASSKTEFFRRCSAMRRESLTVFLSVRLIPERRGRMPRLR